jgi:hypothetical protein
MLAGSATSISASRYSRWYCYSPADWLAVTRGVAVRDELDLWAQERVHRERGVTGVRGCG